MLGFVNRGLKRFAYVSQGIFLMALKMVGGIFRRPFYFNEIMEQMYLIGIGSLYLVILTGIFAGQGFALAFSVELADFGAKNYLGRIMTLAIVRELGPVLTALMIAARVAAGITAELGSMKSSNQIDALTAFGIDPIKKLAVPRLLALMVMVPALTVITDAIALLGGYVIALFMANVTTTMYWSAVKERLNFGNIFVGLFKPVVFSFFIAFIACYKGFYSEGGTKGVGRATTESVVLSSITILVINFLITKVVFSFLKGYL